MFTLPFPFGSRRPLFALRAPACLALLAFAGSAALAQASFTRGSTPWPDIPTPPKAKVQWVSDDMRVNGIPMRVQTFNSEASKEEVVAYYTAYWKTAQTPPQPGKTVAAVTPKGDDTLVARAHGPFYSMVQVRSAGPGRSSGTISTSQLLGVDPKIDSSGVPAPSGATAVNVVEAIDNGKRNKQVLFISRDSLDSVSGYYQRSLARDGWALLQEQVGKSDKTDDAPTSALVRMYGRDKQQLDLAMGVDASNGVTVINANLISY